MNDYLEFQKILIAYSFRGYDKGVKGIYMRLLRMGIRMNHKKIRRLMRKFGLVCPIRKPNAYRQMIKKMRTDAVTPNVVKREFKEHGPRKIFLTDITYIPYRNHFCYLSVITDAFTKQVLSYVISKNLKVDFVLETVQQLLKKHQVEIDDKAMIHSDQGAHYTSTSFRRLLEDYNLRQSMSRRGNCWDNAPQESFFGHMKQELKPYLNRKMNFQDIKERIDDWINYYNNDRYQENLNKLSPNEYYAFIENGILPNNFQTCM